MVCSERLWAKSTELGLDKLEGICSVGDSGRSYPCSFAHVIHLQISNIIAKQSF